MQRVEVGASMRILARTSHKNPCFDVAIRVPESVSTYHVMGSGCPALRQTSSLPGGHSYPFCSPFLGFRIF